MGDDNKRENNKSFVLFSIELAADVVLGALLGVIVNNISTYIGHVFNLPRYGVIIIQFIFICIILYLLKIESKYLGSSWQNGSYGIIFIAAFIGVQKNLVTLFGDMHNIL